MASSKDFVANQIRSAKLIMTGTQSGDGGVGVRNIGLAVYDESVALNSEGTVNDSNLYDNAGTDVAIIVSGSTKSRGTNATAGGVVLFGGDTFVSGTLVVENAGRSHGSISGSIHHTSEGKSYLVAAGGIAISSASNGQVTIDGSGITGGGDASLEYYDESNVANPFSPNASGQYAVAIGTHAQATGQYSQARGFIVTASLDHDTISGGTANYTYANKSSSSMTRGKNVIGGGQSNFISASHKSVIVGGGGNIISGTTGNNTSTWYNFIGGGQQNKIVGHVTNTSHAVENSFIGGGKENLIGDGGPGNPDNSAAASLSFIGGGELNKIQQGKSSAILAGYNNLVLSDNSFALGNKNRITTYNHGNVYSLGTNLTSSNAHQLLLGFGEGPAYPAGVPNEVVVSGSYFKSDGINGGAITGSITRTKEGLSYLVAGANMTITSQSNGQIIFESSGGGGGGNTLDQAYDEGGAGAGSEITVDSGPVVLKNSTSGDDTLVFEYDSNTHATASITSDGKLILTTFDQGSNNSDVILNPDGKVIIRDNANNTAPTIAFTKTGTPFGTGLVEGENDYYIRRNSGNDLEVKSNNGILLQPANFDAVIVNDSGTSTDFRVESNNLASAILVDGGDDTVVLGSNVTTFAGLPAEAKGDDVAIVLSGSAKHKLNGAATGRGTILATGDLVTSGTFYADSIDAGERHTYGEDGPRLHMSGSGFTCFSSTFKNPDVIRNNGILHTGLQRKQTAGDFNVMGYVVSSIIPSGSRKVEISVIATAGFTGAGGARLNLRVSGSQQQLFGPSAPTNMNGGGSVVLDDTSTFDNDAVTGFGNNPYKYRRLTKTFDLATDFHFDVEGSPNSPAYFGIFREDSNGEQGSHVKVLMTEVQFKM